MRAMVFLVVIVIPGLLSAFTRVVVRSLSKPALGTHLFDTIVLPFALLVLWIFAEVFTHLRDVDGIEVVTQSRAAGYGSL